MLDNDDIIKLSEVFVTKEDLKDFATKSDVLAFKNEILTVQDKILEELKTLTQEKTFEDEQDKKQKRILEIHNNALKNHKILSENESAEIEELRVF